MSALPLVTVNVLAHNRREELGTSLRTMHEALDYPRDRLEFIVVDNDSTDGTREMLREEFPDVLLIENENVGSAGWTRGFRAGKGDYFLILDDDCYIDGGSLRQAVEAAEACTADLVSFRVISSFDPGFEFNAEYKVGLLSYWGCAALVSRRAIDALEGYDPNIFIWANELEFTIRLFDKGFRHLFLPEVTAVHIKRPGTSLPIWVYATHMRHLAYVVTKLLQPADAAVVLANLTSKLVLGLLRTPARWRVVVAVARGVAMGLPARAPVRPEVSRLYRANFREFTSPMFYLRDPVALWKGRRRLGGIRAYLKTRHEDFYASRPDLYPAERSTLRLPR